VKSLWRIIQRKYAQEAFSGEGSAKYGARWNQKGTAVLYCFESASLAQLEVLVRTQQAKDLALYVLIEARLPEELIETLPHEDLPDDWNALPEANSKEALFLGCLVLSFRASSTSF
jgi:RES domain-containing protein